MMIEHNKFGENEEIYMFKFSGQTLQDCDVVSFNFSLGIRMFLGTRVSSEKSVYRLG